MFTKNVELIKMLTALLLQLRIAMQDDIFSQTSSARRKRIVWTCFLHPLLVHWGYLIRIALSESPFKHTTPKENALDEVVDDMKKGLKSGEGCEMRTILNYLYSKCSVTNMDG